MNRRGLLKTAAGLLVATGAGELLLPEGSEIARRVWALDQTMVKVPQMNPVDLDIAQRAFVEYVRQQYVPFPHQVEIIQFMYQQGMISQDFASIAMGWR